MLKGGHSSSFGSSLAAPVSAPAPSPFHAMHSSVSEMRSPLDALAAPSQTESLESVFPKISAHQSDSAKQEAKDKAVKHMMELMKPKSANAQPSKESVSSSDTSLPNPATIFSGPSPNAAPVSQEPVHKA